MKELHEPDSSPFGDDSDRLCDEFEGAWQQDLRPQIEEFLLRAAPKDRMAVLYELILLDLSYRRMASESPQPREYLQRFPEDQETVERAFARSVVTVKGETALTFRSPTSPRSDAVSTSARYSGLTFHDKGGLGEVYYGKDESLGRQVAIKFVHHNYLADEEVYEQFRTECEVTSRLDHPGVVPVYNSGEDWDGRPFFVMRFIQGSSLLDAIESFHGEDWRTRGRAAERMELHRLLGHLIAACNTIAYAHHRGIVHCDLKPEHVMLGRYGETLLVDWGLAQRVARDAHARASGEPTLRLGDGAMECEASGAGGTIGYISPEQTPGSGRTLSTASDIYSLGAILYKLLTGQTAFRRKQGEDVWEAICRGVFPRPREVNSRCPRALEAVCLKAMALQPHDRYATAEEFAGELQRWMMDEPVSVYREPRFEQLMRYARRHRSWTVAAVSAAVLTLGVAIVWAMLLGQQAERESRLLAVAERAREAHLRTSAIYGAETFGYEIADRWKVLAEQTADPELHRLLQAAVGKAADSPEWKSVQGWLDHRAGPWIENRKAATWFITDSSGMQLARYPASKEPTIGRSFRHRTYFHGGQRDFLESSEEAKKAMPIRTPTLSAVYESEGDREHELKVAFAVPIWKSQRHADDAPLGILGMSVNLGGFVKFQTENTVVALADLRMDWLEGRPQVGLFLDHPNLAETRKAQSLQSGRGLIRFDDQERIARLQELRRVRARELNWGQENDKTRLMHPASLERAFRDPVAGPMRDACMAAFEPVFVRNHNAEPVDIGWIIIVLDKTGDQSDARAESAKRQEGSM